MRKTYQVDISTKHGEQMNVLFWEKRFFESVFNMTCKVSSWLKKEKGENWVVVEIKRIF